MCFIRLSAGGHHGILTRSTWARNRIAPHIRKSRTPNKGNGFLFVLVLFYIEETKTWEIHPHADFYHNLNRSTLFLYAPHFGNVNRTILKNEQTWNLGCPIWWYHKYVASFPWDKPMISTLLYAFLLITGHIFTNMCLVFYHGLWYTIGITISENHKEGRSYHVQNIECIHWIFKAE